MTLFILPNELILQIASYLSPNPLSHLILTNSFLSTLLTPLLHTLALAPVDNESPLIWASHRGHLPLVKLLLNSPTIEVNPPLPRFATTALHAAAENGHTSIVALLLEHGANVNVIDRWNFTPLLDAVFSGKEEIARMLLEHGADMDPEGSLNPDDPGDDDIFVEPAVALAVESGTCGMLEILLQQLQREGRAAWVINRRKSMHGRNVLHMAAETPGREEIVALLLAFGADVNLEEDWPTESTPLHLAAREGNLEGVRILVEWGADVGKVAKMWLGSQRRRPELMTPLEMAKFHGQEAVVKFLEDLERGL